MACESFSRPAYRHFLAEPWSQSRGRCNREKPPCKYFHPPQHLKDQLLINGRNHLALKNALLQQMPLQAMLPGQLPTAVHCARRHWCVASAEDGPVVSHRELGTSQAPLSAFKSLPAPGWYG
ncbi:unnamed protein product, partial [Ixodes pacificus]